MIKNKILLPHQYYYPNMELIADRCNNELKREFIISLEEDKGISNAIMYIHIPFCDSKCAFCGFDKEYNLDEIEFYVKKIKEEIRFYSNNKYIIESIHFGGGTPTILPARYLKDILDEVKNNFTLTDNVIINIEGSATTLYKPEIIDFILNNNIARVSIGVQTFHRQLRERLNLKATLEQVYETINTLKSNNITVFADILYGYPDLNVGRPSDIVKSDIREAIRLNIDGIDFSQVYPYSNKLEEMMNRGEVEFPSSDELISILKDGTQLMEANGYIQNTAYGFIKKGDIIIETSYYGGQNKIPDCIAIGSGAFGFINGYKYRNSSYSAYVNFETPSYLQIKKLSKLQLENMQVVGFPKLLSLSKNILTDKLYERYKDKLEKLKDLDLILENDKEYLVTTKGRNYIDNIYYYMLENEEKEIIDKQLKVLILK